MSAAANIQHDGPSGLDLMDRMPPDVRRCVHDFGLQPVFALWTLGIRDARHIRHAINAVRLGAREPANRPHRARGRNEALIDDFLMQRCGQTFARELVAFLRANSLTVLPIEPVFSGVEASLSALNAAPLVSKTEKHTRRLRAAIRASDAAMWGPRT